MVSRSGRCAAARWLGSAVLGIVGCCTNADHTRPFDADATLSGDALAGLRDVFAPYYAVDVEGSELVLERYTFAGVDAHRIDLAAPIAYRVADSGRLLVVAEDVQHEFHLPTVEDARRAADLIASLAAGH